MTLFQFGIIIILTVVYMVVGSLWYSKWLFGGIWAKLTNIDASSVSKEAVKKAFILGTIQKFLKSLLIFYFVINLSFLLPETYFLLCSILVGLILLEGLNDYIWSGKSKMLQFITSLQVLFTTLLNIVIATYLLG